MDTARRAFLKTAGTALAVGAVLQTPLSLAAQSSTPPANPAAPLPPALPKLAYAYDALEPHIDAKTMELHHTKHHQAYVDGLLKAEAELANARDAGDFGLIQHWSRSLSFNYGGHYLHSMFWSTLAPQSAGGGGEPTGALADKLAQDFGNVAAFKKQLTEAAAKVEGGGWGLLHYSPMQNKLFVAQAESQNKLALWGTEVLLGVDVWEHAYYLKYQNRRAEYLAAWWNVVNWNAVAERFEKARG